jgi:hypothetical protein
MTSYNLPLNIDRAVIEVNGGCNYTCNMCPQTEGRGQDWLRKTSLKDFERIVAACADHGLRIVNLEGSGEPTLNRNLPDYISIVRKYNAQPYIYTNGYKLSDDFMRRCVDAGLALARFSVIGYNRMQYLNWMQADNFNVIRDNALAMQDYIAQTGSDCTVASYHLILNQSQEQFEVEQYRKNFIDIVGSEAGIWKMHNWSGVYDPAYKRQGQRRSCGRPFAPELTVRAGGTAGTKLSVAPCCQTLGRDSDAELGNLQTQTLEQVWNGDRYNWLRQMHAQQRFDEVPFCRDCDFLYDDHEVLVWSNSSDIQINKLRGTNFKLDEYMP